LRDKERAWCCLQAETRLEHLEELIQELSQSRQNSASHDGTISDATTVQVGKDELPNDRLCHGATQ
jgi:hypothetical protein